MTFPLPYRIDADDEIQENFDALARALPSPLRIIRGRVTTLGVITAGTGFTVTKGGAGLYTINFTNAFFAAPTVTVLSAGPNADSIFISTAVSTTATTLQCYVVSLGALTNQDFHFQVVAA